MQNVHRTVRPTEIVGIISHELRTPLATILGCGELLEDDAEAGANVGFYATRIRKAGETLREVVADLIEFSKLSLAERQVDVRAIALPTLWREAGGRCAALGAPGVAIDWQPLIPDRLVELDAAIVTRALWHVVGNAVKFTDRGTVYVRGDLHDGVLTITVQDPGIGIDPSYFERIFEPFWQVDSSLVRQHGGVGLGLHLACRSLQQIGGTIAVTSRLGGGSTFILAVPCAPSRPSAVCDPESDASASNGPGEAEVHVERGH